MAMMNRWINPFLSKISSDAVSIYDFLFIKFIISRVLFEWRLRIGFRSRLYLSNASSKYPAVRYDPIGKFIVYLP